MSSMFESPMGRRAASVFCEATVSRSFSARPKAALYFASASSMSFTATATWSIFTILNMTFLLSLVSLSLTNRQAAGALAHEDRARDLDALFLHLGRCV